MSGSIHVPQTPDYADAHSWAFTPWTPPQGPVDPSTVYREADVFFAPGTLLSGFGKRYYDVQNPEHRAMALRPRLTQASAFAKAGSIYQPHCRQVSMEMNMLPRVEMEAAYQVPYADLRAAFLYYVEHWNLGRPFLLVGHSQGSVLLLRLLQDALADESLRRQLVAAYILGFSVTREDLMVHPGLKLAERADDTGVIITYNTLTKDGSAGLTLFPGALCVNPLNWVNTPEYASADLHLGRVFFDENGEISREIPHFTDAWIDPKLGALKVGAISMDMLEPDPFFPAGDLHRGNISLFYRNLEENAVCRTAAFLSQQQQFGPTD